MNKGLVFAIEEFSTFDGPGIRTTVFLKGCPLRCEWCHNPEGQSFENMIIRSPNGCINCGACLRTAIRKSDKIFFTDAAVYTCPNRLLRHCAEEYDSDALIRRLSRNFIILNPDGGITFSGGEPLSQPEFLIECLKKLKGQVNRAVQTSGFSKPEVFNSILPETDYMLFDIKLMDESQHIKYTGCSNKWILKNFKSLCQSGKDFVIRTPLIPGVTDTYENITAIAELLQENQVNIIELMPYNNMAGAKYPLAGMKYQPSFDTKTAVNPHLEIFESHGIKARIL